MSNNFMLKVFVVSMTVDVLTIVARPNRINARPDRINVRPDQLGITLQSSINEL